MKISLHIYSLLKNHDCVIIPNFGAFVCRNISAKISPDKSKIYPPNKELSFNRSLIKNDGLLINYISEKENLSYKKAEKRLTGWVNENLKKLEDKEVVEILNIGALNLRDSKFIFFPDRNSIILKSSFGLKTIESNELIKTKSKISNSYLRYAAILVLAISLTGVLSKSYFDSINEFNTASLDQANKQIERKIQKARDATDGLSKKLETKAATFSWPTRRWVWPRKPKFRRPPKTRPGANERSENLRMNLNQLIQM